MALALDPARIVEPLAPDDPCGDDLDEAGDIDFLNGVSRAEGLLPASFFTRDAEGRQQAFDRGGIDFKREKAALLGLLDRTRDLRVLVLLARLAMLDRDLAGFVAALGAIAGLLDARWETVHPRGEDGDHVLRCAVLQSLDDVPTVILPLQHAPLLGSRRHGPISFRSVMVADGEVPGREDEPGPDRAAIIQARDEAEPEAVRALADAAGDILAGAARIADLTAEKAGHAGAVRLERLEALAGRIRDLLAAGGGVRDTAAADAAADAPAPASAAPVPAANGRIADAADASAALAAVALYLRSREPSSPAEVLVRQAQMLVGKTFVEVMRILMPDKAAEATIAMGANRSLHLTFEQLAAVPEEAADVADDGWGAASDTSDEADEAVPVEPFEGAIGGESPAPRPVFRAATRAEAGQLLREAGQFFRTHEPSSPIPLLLDKAAAMADRDFLTILRDVMPEPTAA